MVASGDKLVALTTTTIEGNTSSRPLVRLIQQVAQSIPNSTNTALTFGAGSEDIDTHNYHDTATNNSRVTPLKAGYYRCTATYQASAHVPSQAVVIGKNGTAVQPFFRATPAATVAAKSVMVVATVSCNGTTDYIQAIVNQNSGGAQDTQASGGLNSVLEVEYIRDL